MSRAHRPDPVRAVVAGCALLAAGLQILSLTRPNAMLSGGSHDSGLYLGSAIRLVHGVMPYRDFALLQPPGLVVLYAPYALLSLATGSRVALMAMTACTPLLAAANVVLIGRLVGHRGWPAAVVACGLMAVYPAMYDALLDGVLEPLMVLFTLIGAVQVFDRDGPARPRRLVAGGVAIGFATSVLVVAVLPALVVAALLVTRPRQRLLPFVSGGLAGVLVPALPFLLLSPGSLFHETVATQLARAPGAVRSTTMDRLLAMTFGGGRTGMEVAVAVAGAVILAGLVAVRRRLLPLDWFALGTSVAVGGAQFAIAIYFPHFPAMLIPFVAVLLAVSVSRISLRWSPRLVPAIAAMAVAGLTVAQVAVIEGTSAEDAGAAVDAVVPANGCALSDEAQVLVQGDRFWSSVPGCTAMTDPVATELADAGSPAGAYPDLRAALLHTDYLVLDRPVSRWLGGDLASLAVYVQANFQLHGSGQFEIYVRDGFPSG